MHNNYAVFLTGTTGLILKKQNIFLKEDLSLEIHTYLCPHTYIYIMNYIFLLCVSIIKPRESVCLVKLYKDVYNCGKTLVMTFFSPLRCCMVDTYSNEIKIKIKM